MELKQDNKKNNLMNQYKNILKEIKLKPGRSSFGLNDNIIHSLVLSGKLLGDDISSQSTPNGVNYEYENLFITTEGDLYLTAWSQNKTWFMGILAAIVVALLLMVINYFLEQGDGATDNNGSSYEPSVNQTMFARKPSNINEARKDCSSVVQVPIRQGALWNLALLKSAKIYTDSNINIETHLHKSRHVNDGWYSNCKSWIPFDTSEHYMEIDFGRMVKINKLAISNDNTGQFKDRRIVSVRVEINNQTVLRLENQSVTTSLDIQLKSIDTRAIKVFVKGASYGHPPRVDELVVWGTPLELVPNK
ncbi:MAG: hypothetical protein COB38_12990 [Gammaproteobacteria bacterium]|nr:MAG: hypothetical protein COB38_12990 [Gammaproteobacteria bacterium]